MIIHTVEGLVLCMIYAAWCQCRHHVFLIVSPLSRMQRVFHMDCSWEGQVYGLPSPSRISYCDQVMDCWKCHYRTSFSKVIFVKWNKHTDNGEPCFSSVTGSLNVTTFTLLDFRFPLNGSINTNVSISHINSYLASVTVLITGSMYPSSLSLHSMVDLYLKLSNNRKKIKGNIDGENTYPSSCTVNSASCLMAYFDLAFLV